MPPPIPAAIGNCTSWPMAGKSTKSSSNTRANHGKRSWFRWIATPERKWTSAWKTPLTIGITSLVTGATSASMKEKSGRRRSKKRRTFNIQRSTKGNRARRNEQFAALPPMIGTVLNVAAILLCGLWAILTPRKPSAKVQNAIKGLLGVMTIIVGLRLTVTNLGGGWSHFFKQLGIILGSLTLGRILGQLLHLQKLSNRLGQFAKRHLESTAPRNQRRFTDGFTTTSLLFCLAPLAFLGAIQDGLAGNWQTLAIKAVMDGLTVLAFVTTFGSSVIVAALPVFAFQG